MATMFTYAIGLGILAGVLAAEGARAGETLYNGIALPDTWPPARSLEDLRTGEPMALPYLKNPPAQIPIDVGRQLFVDDFLVEQTTLKRRFHKAEFYDKNPVLFPNKRWEMIYQPARTAMAFSDGVFYDPQDKLFKMWYMSARFGDTAYATSPDGIVWNKPALDVRPNTNVVLLAGQRDSSTVWLDLETSDPQQRYKLFQFNRDCWRASLHTSADGIHWSEPVWCEACGDRSTVFYNPFRKVWVFGLRDALYAPPWDYNSVPPKPIGRSRRYWESKDFLAGARWKGYREGAEAKPDEPGLWVACDRNDWTDAGPNDVKAELYNLDAVGYESLMVGFFSVLHSGSRAGGRPKINDVMLGFSRDGFHWDRPLREAVVPVSEKPEAWNWANVQSVGGGCLVVGDKLYLYASGRNAKDETTGLAFLRRDGFASMDAGEAEGALTTRPVLFKGKHLFVNVAAPQGELRVEALDREGRPAAPFTRENCDAIRADKTLQLVKWRGADDLSSLAGRPVKFRFHLKNGSLYSFWVSPDESGASHGYVAAGGPGFTGPADTVGVGAYQAAQTPRQEK